MRIVGGTEREEEKEEEDLKEEREDEKEEENLKEERRSNVVLVVNQN